MFKKRSLMDSVFKTLDLVEAGKIMAHPGFIKTELADLLDICNGCGAAGSKLPVPDTIWGLWVGPNCNLHDYRYHIGKTEFHKQVADLEMLSNNLRAIEECSVWFLKPMRRQRALTYYAAVTDLGDAAFWAGKDRPEEQ